MATKQRSPLSFIAPVFILGIACLILVAVINTCRSDYWRGRAKIDENPEAAYILLLHGILADDKTSYECLVTMASIDSVDATRHLIGLMDLPDGNFLKSEFRTALHKRLLERLEGLPSPPPYDPNASYLLRHQAKIRWLEWFEDISTGRKRVKTDMLPESSLELQQVRKPMNGSK